MEPGGSRLVIYGNANAEFRLYDLSDLHLGNKACAKHLLAQDVEKIRRDPYALWLLGGDYADFIPVTDKRWSPQSVDDEIFSISDLDKYGAVILDELNTRLVPIADKCLGACFGNHEVKYMTTKEAFAIHDEVCELLDCANMRYSGFISLFFEYRKNWKKAPLIIKNPVRAQVGKPGQVLLKVFISHGFSTAQSAGGRVNALKRMGDMLSGCDLAVMGHLHEQIAKTIVRLGTDDRSTTINETTCQCLLSGSYLRSYPEGHVTYSEIKGYAPSTLGAGVARYSPASKVLTVEAKTSGVGKTF